MIIEENFNESEGLNSMTRFFGFVLMISVVMLSPYYIYSSGMPQPAHIIMLLASLGIIAINFKKAINKVKKNLYTLAFLSLIVVINSAYYLIYQKISFLINSFYWLYGYLMLLSVVFISKDVVLGKWIKLIILLQMVFIILSYLIGWGGFAFWPRYEFFFNGPNQLAYFALCLLIVYVALDQGALKPGLYGVYFLTACAVIISGGRSIYAAFVPLIIIFLFIAKGRRFDQILLATIPVVVIVIFRSYDFPLHTPLGVDRLNISINTFNRFVELCVSCDSSNYYSIENQLRGRGYMRAFEYPEYMLFGAGQGFEERFGSIGGFVYEIHSSLFAVIFYYGFLGFYLFSMSIYKIFEIKNNIFLLTPLFIYGLFTYGLRSPYFWIALGFVVLLPDLFEKNNQLKLK